MASIGKTTLWIAGQALWVTGLFAAQPTVQDATKFIEDAEQRLLVLGNEAQQASWVQENFITSDTEALAARANQRATDEQVRLAKESKRFDGLALPPDLARKLRLLRIGFTLATPADPKESEEVSNLATELDGMYGRGKYCPPALAERREEVSRHRRHHPHHGHQHQSGRVTRCLEGLARRFAAHAQGFRPLRRSLANKGARELGFKDNGAMWRSKYDMPPDDFAKELDRLWEQVRPLYLSLHAYVRNRLREKYGDAVPASGPIPALSAGQHLGAGVGQYLPAGRARRRRPRLRSHRPPQEAQGHRLEAW
jgi:peptidyl-dipeptidase A